MKRNFLLLGLAVLTLASFSTIDSDKKYIKKTPILEQSNDGERLIAKSDCVGCHKLDKKMIGPSYVEIAKKYPNNEKNVNYLAGKIIKGGWCLGNNAHVSSLFIEKRRCQINGTIYFGIEKIILSCICID